MLGRAFSTRPAWIHVISNPRRSLVRQVDPGSGIDSTWADNLQAIVPGSKISKFRPTISVCGGLSKAMGDGQVGEVRGLTAKHDRGARLWFALRSE